MTKQDERYVDAVVALVRVLWDCQDVPSVPDSSANTDVLDAIRAVVEFVHDMNGNRPESLTTIEIGVKERLDMYPAGVLWAIHAVANAKQNARRGT